MNYDQVIYFIFTFAFTEGLAAVVVEKGARAKAGFIDDKGKFIIKPQFDDASQFSEGFAAVNVGKNRGYIDKNGIMVI
ncbi:MAG: WG repeat-containing protein [Oryzomonas sp.]|uniref:WG repeat-containing protein n=1 Tax=Oryzomonas sp. TaxID=2855186 RepID=UPI00284F09A8|nr:WG repeat-containing protein [Oryzomonas sp.]MDR3581344.1 WG repeat-containing protein [Oryzomonas sp.]